MLAATPAAACSPSFPLNFGVGLGQSTYTNVPLDAGDVVTATLNSNPNGRQVRVFKSAPLPEVDMIPLTTASTGSGTYTAPSTGLYDLSALRLGPFDGNFASVTMTCAPGTPAPTVTSVSPDSGFPTGGQTVVITGTDFTGATSVTFGGDPATSFIIDSATQITAVSPARAVGPADIVVTTPGGSSANTVADDFAYVVYTVPTLSEWAMILFGLLLAGAAALTLNRRRTA